MLLALAAVSPLAGASPVDQDPGPDGLVIIEAEAFDASVSQGGHSWISSLSPPSGFSGSGTMEAAPNNGGLNNTNYVTNSPRLDYQVNFVKTGIHYVWVRGFGATTGDDSVHVGLDGVAQTSADRITYFPPGLAWSGTRQNGVIASIDVATAGLHTLNLWMREDGTIVDQIQLTTNDQYAPAVQPAELLYLKNFDEGNTVGWQMTDNCPTGTADWSVQSGVLMHTYNCNGFSADGMAMGTWQTPGPSFGPGIDMSVDLRSQDPKTDAVSSNDSSNLRYGIIGVVFAYQDMDNHYRLELNARRGYRKLWRVQGGIFTELATSPQSYTGEQWFELRVVHQNDVILVFIDGVQVLAAADNSFSSGKTGLFCAVNGSCSFDNLVVRAAPAEPLPGMAVIDSISPPHASGEYAVTANDVLDIQGLTTLTSGVGGMEFVLDEGTAGEISVVDSVAPYAVQFAALFRGEHAVTGYLLDNNQARIPDPTATGLIPRLGTGGIQMLALGDSITNGLFDSIGTDDISLDLRNTGGGYTPVLNDHLSANNNDKPVSVLNEGISGERTLSGLDRLPGILARTPTVQAYLIGYGTNDSGGSLPLMSGLGKNPGDSGYAGSYKHYLQQMIDAIVPAPPAGAGKLVFFARIPPYLGNTTRDSIIQEFNQVIDELTVALQIQYPARYSNYQPPDFHAYFTLNPGEMDADQIHPNGTGYQSMARLWCEALNGLEGWFCLDGDRDGLLDSVEALLGTDPGLADTDGDGLADGRDGLVPLGEMPGGIDTDGDGFVDGEQMFSTDPLLADSDGDRLTDGIEVVNNADPLDAADWPALADGDLAPLNAPDGLLNAGDLLLARRIALGLQAATPLELAHGDLYPPGTPDGTINLQDLILLRQMLQ